jgi:O-antigen/teichoic acid export membrane protein
MGDKENGASPLFTSITRKTLLIMINFVMMGVIGVISWKFVATYMPAPDIGGAPNEIGLVTAALSFVGIFSFITNLGFGSSHIKRISQGEDLGKCIGTYFTVQLVSIIVLIGVVIIALTFWADLLGYGYEDPRFEYTVFIILGYYAANNLATVGLQTFVAKVEIAKNQMILFIAALVQLIVTLFVVILTDDLYLYAITFVVGSFVSLFITVFYLIKLPIKPPSWRIFKSYLIFALPLFLVSALAVLTPHIDKIMVYLFWDSSSVAIYFGGQKFSLYLIYISTGLGMILFPTFSKLKSKGKHSEIKELVYNSERLIIMMMGPICAIVFALSLPIVTLLGASEYAASYLVLQPLALWGFFKSLNAPYRNLLMGIGKPKVLAIASVVGIVSVVVLNIIFIPEDIQSLGIKLLGLGPRGAALATLLSVVATMLTYRLFSYRYQKVIMNPKIIKFAIASLLTAGAIYLINYFLPATNIILMILYAAGGIVVYFVVLLILRALNDEDKALFKSVMNPVTMVKYIKDELLNRNKDQH